MGEVYKPAVLTQDTTGEDGVWGKVSEGEVGEERVCLGRDWNSEDAVS